MMDGQNPDRGLTKGAIVTGNRFPMNTWPIPSPLGFPAAVEVVGSIAAPLLAGFSLTLLALVVGSANLIRWPNLAILGLAIASVLMITTVQCAFWARQYSVKPTEAIAWHPDFETEEGRKALREDIWEHDFRFKIWSRRARWTYNSGTAVLFASVAIALVPNMELGKISSIRWIAIATPLLGALIEVAWAISDRASTGSTWVAVLLRQFLYPTPKHGPPDENFAD